MNVLIVEDEYYAAERLSLLLAEFPQQINIIDKLDSIKTVVDFVNKSSAEIDLIFMDIELSDGLCFEIFKQVQLDIPVVFTTAYDQYAVKAFDMNSIHYLLKPVSKEDISKALEKFHSMDKIASVNMSALSELLQGVKKTYKTHFLGKYGGTKLIHKHVNSVGYFYSDERVVYMVDIDRKKYLIDCTLEELADEQLDPVIFYRISRKYIVNIGSIEILKKYSQQRLQLFLSQGQEHEIIVSRERVTDFKNWLNK